MFQDITTLLLDHSAFKDVVDIFVDRYRDMDISVVAGKLLYFSLTSSACTTLLEVRIIFNSLNILVFFFYILKHEWMLVLLCYELFY